MQAATNRRGQGGGCIQCLFRREDAVHHFHFLPTQLMLCRHEGRCLCADADAEYKSCAPTSNGRLYDKRNTQVRSLVAVADARQASAPFLSVFGGEVHPCPVVRGQHRSAGQELEGVRVGRRLRLDEETSRLLREPWGCCGRVG